MQTITKCLGIVLVMAFNETECLTNTLSASHEIKFVLFILPQVFLSPRIFYVTNFYVISFYVIGLIISVPMSMT